MARFNLSHVALVREAFPDAEVFVRDDAFVFPTTAAALRYYASGLVDAIDDAPADASHRARLEAEVGAAIEAIVQRDGAFRVTKNTGCFVASA